MPQHPRRKFLEALNLSTKDAEKENTKRPVLSVSIRCINVVVVHQVFRIHIRVRDLTTLERKYLEDQWNLR